MATVLHEVQYSLNVGEVSFRAESRGDLKEYAGALYRALNFQPLTVGGMRFRNGTRHVAPTKSGFAILKAFVFNKFEAYVLEFGDFYVRIRHVDGTLVTITPELVTPWPVGMLRDLYVFEINDVMYICSDGTIQVQKLQRVGAEEFQLLQVNFFAPGTVADEPTGCEIGAGTLTPGATTGNGVTFTASSPGFVLADVGRIIVYLGSRASISAFVSTTQVTADIIDAFPNTNPIPCDQWRLTGTPDGTANPSTNHIKHNIVVVDFSVQDAIRQIDVGKYIAVYGGFVRIIEVGPLGKQIRGVVVSDLKDVAPGAPSPPTVDWTIWRNAWDSTQGFPVCGTYYQGRIYLCRDQTVWASIVDDIENFALGSSDSDGINRTIADDQVNTIQFIVGTNRLFLGTIGAAYMVTGTGENAPLTPGDFNVQHVSADGSDKIKPVRAKGQVLNVEFAARKVRELLFDFIEAKGTNPNLLALADHFTEENQIQDIVYQQAPDSLVWCPLDSGESPILAYNRDEKLFAWSRYRTDGCFVDFASVPNGHIGRDRVFAIVEREGNFYVEYFDSEAQLSGRQWRGLYTDAATVVAGPSNFTVTGLPDSVEGKTVKVIGDGLLYDDVLVTNNQIAITPQIAATEFEIGLPYTGELITLEPRVPETLGAPWTIKGWAKIGARIRQTLGLELCQMVREEETILANIINFRKISHTINAQIPPQRGKILAPGQAHDTLGRILVRQQNPFPAEVLSIFGLLEVTDAPRGELFDEQPPLELCVFTSPAGCCGPLLLVTPDDGRFS